MNFCALHEQIFSYSHHLLAWLGRSVILFWYFSLFACVFDWFMCVTYDYVDFVSRRLLKHCCRRRQRSRRSQGAPLRGVEQLRCIIFLKRFFSASLYVSFLLLSNLEEGFEIIDVSDRGGGAGLMRK